MLVLNYDNDYTREMEKEAKSRVRFFSLSECTSGAYLKEGKIYFDGKFIMDKSDIILPGIHNTANYLAAISAVRDFVSDETVKTTARTFGGVEHRIEFVREKDGVSYYNDSIGSTPARTIATVSAFPDKVILIAGGYDKHLNYAELGRVIADRVKFLVLIGATSDKIETAAREAGFTNIVRAQLRGRGFGRA